MKVLAIYAINEHIANLHFEAEQARIARRGAPRPSILRRLAGAVRSTARLNPVTAPALA